MITFGNFTYIVYIGLAVFLAAGLFIFYLVWKGRIMKHLSGRDDDYASLVLGSRRRQRFREILILVSILLFGLLILRPQWGENMREVNSEGSDVLIALDVSRSMLARDVAPSRLDRAKDAIRWIAGSLKGDRIGLVLFAGDAFLQCPLTNDIGAFMMFLDAAGPDSISLQGTDIGRMFTQAYRVFEKKRITSKVLVLITDGEDHEGTAIEAVQRFKELGVSVYTVGVGRAKGDFIPAGDDKEGSGGEVYKRDSGGKLIRTEKNPRLLKQLAGRTGGAYLDISESFSGLRFILEIIEDQQRNKYGSRVIKERKERFAPVAILLILLLTLELLVPERSPMVKRESFWKRITGRFRRS